MELNYCQQDGLRLSKTMAIILLIDVAYLRLKNKFVVEPEEKRSELMCQSNILTGVKTFCRIFQKN
jgi:hypothetical protein